MATSEAAPALSLPRSWSRRVRAAVLHAISLARFAVTHGRSQVAGGRILRIRQRVEIDCLRQELALLREELRIKDARMARIPPPRRPHYPPIERLAILELRAARGWTAARTAERLFVTPATIASWMQRLDENGPTALIQTRQPVNKFPDFVAYVVRRLKVLWPSMGKKRIAHVLCRAGLHLGTTTVARMLHESPRPAEEMAASLARGVRARRPNHVWHMDLTIVPTQPGLWTSWLPWALPQRWPFCWWVAVVMDQFSRRIMGVAVFEKQPTAVEAKQALDSIIRGRGSKPDHLITDRGRQFVARSFRRWCRRRGIRQRFGAIGKNGSIATIERVIRTLKHEGLCRLFVPFGRPDFERELGLIVSWYNDHRPHGSLEAATPSEAYAGRMPAAKRRRYEPRAKWPRGAPCASPAAPARAPRGSKLRLNVTYLGDRRHLPIVSLRRAA